MWISRSVLCRCCYWSNDVRWSLVSQFIDHQYATKSLNVAQSDMLFWFPFCSIVFIPVGSLACNWKWCKAVVFKMWRQIQGHKLPAVRRYPRSWQATAWLSDPHPFRWRNYSKFFGNCGNLFQHNEAEWCCGLPSFSGDFVGPHQIYCGNLCIMVVN